MIKKKLEWQKPVVSFNIVELKGIGMAGTCTKCTESGNVGHGLCTPAGQCSSS